MYNKAVFISISIFLLSACASPAAPEPTIDVAKIQTDVAATFSAELTAAAPTNTPPPTNTPLPTNTPRPTITPTPQPQPVILTGTGDSIVDFVKWSGPAILHVKHVGGSNFILKNYPANGNEYYDLLINTIGSYEGTLPLDFIDGQLTARFEVKAGGQWEIQVLPFDTIRREIIPGVIQGVGDDVLAFRTTHNTDVLKVDASQASGNFIIHAFTRSGKIDLAVNEIAPYTGTVLLDSGTVILIINTTGPWSLDITVR